jgi:hypothetical protein
MNVLAIVFDVENGFYVGRLSQGAKKGDPPFDGTTASAEPAQGRIRNLSKKFARRALVLPY